MNPVAGNATAFVRPDLWIMLLKSAAMLSLVLGVLIGILFLVRHLFYAKTGSDLIRTLAFCYIAPKQRLVLIEVMGEKLLLGITPHTINCLAKISSDQTLETIAPEPSGFFSSLMRKAMNKPFKQNELEGGR